MVQVKVLRTFSADGMKVEGQTIEVTEQRARQLERKGLVTLTIGGSMKPKSKGERVDPTPSRQTGSRTGGENDASSSRQGRQRTASTSTNTADEPASSSSTTRGNSRRGRKSSMAATTRGGKNTKASRTSKD